MSKIAFLFSGQGAQYPGMMNDLYSEIPAVAEVFNRIDNALGRSISKMCFEGTQEELNLTHNTQPCVLAADLAAFVAITSYGINPDVVAGFSLGEFAALTAAGVFSIENVAKIIQIRADAMQNAVPIGQGGMAAIIGAESEQVDAICKKAGGYVIPANYNSVGQIVISGEAEAVNKAVEIASEMELRAMPLAVSAPFHCKLMEPASAVLKEKFSDMVFGTPNVPIYTNIDALPTTDASVIPEKLVLQAKSPVLWQKTLENMREHGVDTFVELGSGKTLSGFVKRTLKGVKILRVENIKTLSETVEQLNAQRD